MEGHVIVRYFQACGWGQNDVGVAGGFVDIDVKGKHKFQFFKSLVQLSAIGCGENGVAAAGYHAFYLILAFGHYLFCECSDWQFSQKLWQTSYSALPTI